MANWCVKRWHTTTKRSNERMMAVRALNWDWKGATKMETRSRNVGLGEKAMKNCESVGDEGVTIIAGRDDFSLVRGRDKLRGAGIRG